MNRALTSTAFLAALLASPLTAASQNLVQNGGFETAILGFSDSHQVGLQLPGWNGGSQFGTVFAPKTADATGQPDLYVAYPYKAGLWGPLNPGGGPNNGLTPTSPAGGNFVALEPDTPLPLTQTINGLVVGQTYKVSFYFAAAKYVLIYPGYVTDPDPGATSSGFRVGFGGYSYSTGNLAISPQGFSGWNYVQNSYVATATSMLLSFTPTQGSAYGLPPAALLDGVSITGAPEPASWAVMVAGVAGLAAMARRKRARETHAKS